MTKNYTLFYFCNTYQSEQADSELIRNHEQEDKGMLTKEEKAKYSPSERVLKTIMDFAKSYDTVKTVSAGYVEMNLN